MGGGLRNDPPSVKCHSPEMFRSPLCTLSETTDTTTIVFGCTRRSEKKVFTVVYHDDIDVKDVSHFPILAFVLPPYQTYLSCPSVKRTGSTRVIPENRGSRLGCRFEFN